MNANILLDEQINLIFKNLTATFMVNGANWMPCGDEFQCSHGKAGSFSSSEVYFDDFEMGFSKPHSLVLTIGEKHQLVKNEQIRKINIERRR